MSNNIDFTQTRPPETRLKTLVRAHSHKPKNKFGDSKFVFMHVGKTGGTSINSFLQNCHKAGLRVPIVLNHNWSFQMARLRYPKAKIFVVLRDPLERIISGFNFRLREGRPAGHPWTANEAIVYSHFGNVDCFMDALCSDDPRDISALRFCFRNINHLRRGYRYHFGDIRNEPNRSTKTLHAIPIGDIDLSLPKLIQNLNKTESADMPKVGNMYKSPTPSSNLVEDEKYIDYLQKVKSKIKSEYDTYNFLNDCILHNALQI